MSTTDWRLQPSAPGGGRRSGRASRRRRQRARRRVRLAAGGLVLALVLAGLAGLLTLLITGGDPVGDEAPAAVDEPGARGPEQDTLLLVVHAEEGPADAITLFAAGPGAGATALLVPVGTLVPLPGIGLDRLGLAQQYQGPTLVQSALENALGIRIDHVAAVTESGLGAFLSRSGGVEVDVTRQLVDRAPDGTATVRFEPGRQFLDGPRMAEYWLFRGSQDDELAAFSRQQTILERLFDAARGDPAVLDRLVADGAPQLATAADPAWLRGLFATFAAAHGDDALTFTLLPVEPVGGDGPGGVGTYRLRDQAVRELVGRLLAASVPERDGAEAARLQVLNGVGVPGIGQQVERLLGGGEFRIVRSDNAPSFDFTETRIVIYDETAASRRLAERVQQRLGVGTIQVSRQPQSVVDLTIVVGADFLPVVGAEPPPGAEPDQDEETS